MGLADQPADRVLCNSPKQYLNDPSIEKLVNFFEAKGLTALKEEDRNEQWYDDWIAYQGKHHLYASLLSPKEHSTLGFQFDLLRLTRFFEACAYFSPAHGYSLQCTFLGLFPILMGSNPELKKEAVAALEAGNLFAFGVSEREHGSDLFGNEFVVVEREPGRFVANGAKYYIGNANVAAMISVLARKESSHHDASHSKRAPFVMFALRPDKVKTGWQAQKIRTLGVRAAFVGQFEVKDYELSQSDVIAEGHDAWDAVFGTVTLGKFFLGFGSIGICERAFEESIAHMGQRMLYNKPVIDMPHIRSITAHAFARLTAMKLYAYRALDYLHAASETDRRYQLFNSVQKARVSTEGVKVMALLSDCVGAKGFESDTYFEMALRDIQLIPGLESSMHINLGLTAQFLPRYFGEPDSHLSHPPSLIGKAGAVENPYLFHARTGAIHGIGFGHFLHAYEPLAKVANVGIFRDQVRAFESFVSQSGSKHSESQATEFSLLLGQCLATIVYGQLIAENSSRLGLPSPMVSVIFGLLVNDLNGWTMALTACPNPDAAWKVDPLRQVIASPQTSASDWDFVSKLASNAAAGVSE